MGFGSPSALARAAGRDFCGQKALEASLGKISATESALNLALFFPLIYQNFHSFYLSMGISTKIGAQRELPFTLFREARPAGRQQDG